jgi:hypothetical protein
VGCVGDVGDVGGVGGVGSVGGVRAVQLRAVTHVDAQEQIRVSKALEVADP